jgi:signal transduction histidine kinase
VTSAERPSSGRGSPGDPHARLLTRTRRRLAAVVLLLVGALVVGMGTATALTAIRVLDGEVDRALTASSAQAVGRLESAVAPPSSGGDGDESSDRPPAESDTFHLYLGPDGSLVANPGRVPLGSLPDAEAVAAARANGTDLRTVRSDGADVRLLTASVTHDGTLAGFVQSGFVLTLHDRQLATIILTIIVVGLLGLLGAAVVTVVVVDRALVPIRSAFDTERRFIADASHEIRTPAAIIRASAEVLEREGLVRESGRPLVADVVAEADRLGRLVDDLLALDASDRGSLSLARRPVDLRELVGETAARVGPLAAERGVSVSGPGPGATLVVDADPDRVVQALVVLLDNATRHTPEGGAVVVSVVRSGGHAEVRVDDSGPGVPAADRDRIFEPFARLPGPAGHRGSGSGLGLAIARRIADLHGGSLAVGDAPAGGARFVLSLPLPRGRSEVGV